MVGLPQDQQATGQEPLQATNVAQSGGANLFQQPQIAQGTTPPPPPPTNPTPQDTSSSGGGGGIWGWVEHAASDVTSAVSKAVSHVGVGPVNLTNIGNALNRAYTDVVSHPLSTALTMGNEDDYKNHGFGNLGSGVSFFFKPSNWSQAWQASNHISPGQAVVTGFNNGGVGLGPIAGAKPIDPEDPNAVQALMKRNSVAGVFSGAIDLGTRTYLDPTSLAAKAMGSAAAVAKNAPISDTANTADIERTVTSPRGAKLTEQIAKNNAGPNPMAANLQLKAVKNSSASYHLAALYTAAGPDAAKIQEIQRIAAGDQAALDRLASDAETYNAIKITGPGDLRPTELAGGAGNSGANLPAIPGPTGALVAMRASSLLTPADIEFKSALAPMDPQELSTWLENPSKLKAAHAAAAIDNKVSELQSYARIFGTAQARTTGDYFPGVGRLRAQARLATPSPGSKGLGIVQAPGDFADSVLHPTTFQQVIQNHVADPIIRIYHSFSDARATRMVEFGTNEAVNQVRSLLNTSTVLNPTEKDSMLAEFARRNVQGRSESQLAFNDLEKQLHTRTAEHYGFTPEQGEEAYHEYAARRDLYIQGVGSKAYGELNGDAVFPTYDGSVVTDPFLETQLARGAVPMSDMRDFELALQRMQQSGFAQHASDLGNAAKARFIDTLDHAYGYYKPLVMLTGHRAFNHIGDDLLRSMVKLGATASIHNMGAGMSNFLRNGLHTLTKPLVVRNAEGQWTHEVNDLQSTYHGLKVNYNDQQSRIAAGESVAPENLITPAQVQAAKQAVQNHIDLGPQVPKKLRLGEGTFTVPGTNIKYPEIFGGVDGPYLRLLLSSDHTFNELFDKSARDNYNSQQVMADHDIIGPSAGTKVHGNALIRHINNQLRNDPVAKMMYQGKKDSSIRAWMLNTPEGQARMRALHIGNPMDNIEHVRDSMNTYLPTNLIKQKAFTTGGVTGKDIEATWPNASGRPPVNGNLSLMPHSGSGHEPFIRNTATKLIKVTGSLPDDIFVRHPMAAELYKTNMTRLVKQSIAQGKDVPIGSDLYNMLHKQAIQGAKNTMQQTLYDSTRFVSAGHALRFIMPFFNAWHNAMSSWSHLIAQNPQLVSRGIEAKDALWNSPFAVDTSTGQQANSSTPLNNLSFVMHLPPGLAKSIGMGDLNQLPISAQMVVSPTYADSVLSPGFGPLAQVPANYFVKNDAGLMTNPFIQQITGGRVTANSFQAAIPSSVGEFMDALHMAGLTGDSTQESGTQATMAWSIYQDQYYDYQNGKRSTPPSIEDAKNQASWLYAVSTFVNRLMPLGFKPQSQYRYLTDAYHNMLTANNGNIDQTDSQFYDKYGVAGFIYTQSLAKNVGGVAASVNAAQLYQKYKPLIAKNPDLAAVVIGPDANGAFNDQAYQWEVANGLRTQQDPTAAASAEQINLGWTQFNKVNANIQAELAARGLNSINDGGAQDLKQMKQDFINSTGDPTSDNYNPDFYTSYGSFNPNAYQVRIQALEKIAQDPTLLADPTRSDINSLNAYFQIRSQVYQELQDPTRSSTSLKAKSNLDVAQQFADAIAELKNSDTKFTPLFERYLAKDDLKEP